MSNINIPARYLPKNLTRKDKKTQIEMLKKSRRFYKKGKYFTRSELPSYKSKPSNHIVNARKIYKIDNIVPNKELSEATGCTISALKKIVNKGEGAYFSSGSRPNQTPQSWGLARLASSITSGKSAVVDFSIIDKGCSHNKTAYILAKKSKNKHNNGLRKTRKYKI